MDTGEILFEIINLERNSRLGIDRLLDRVTGDMTLNELMLASFANLKHEIPLAVDLADHGAFTEDNRASSRLENKDDTTSQPKRD